MDPKATTVLIAEDDLVFRRVMQFTIEATGLKVACVADGAAAFERICHGDIGFLVTDYYMPACTGLELLEKLAAQGIPLPPTIMCTAKGIELDSAAMEQDYNLVTVMHKPFSPRKLADLVLQYTFDEDRSQTTV